MSKVRIALVLIIVALLIAGNLHVYAVNETFGGLALWSGSEAYLLFQVGTRGNRSSYLGYLWLLLKEHAIGGFAGAVTPDEGRAYLTVLHVTAGGVERHSLKVADFVTDNSSPVFQRYTPIEGHLYALGPGLLLWRWAGDHFEKATTEEEQRLNGIHNLTVGDFYKTNGWSRRGFGADPAEPDFTIAAGDEFTLAVSHEAIENGRKSNTVVDLRRPSKAPERIAVLERRQGTVSKAEYQHALRDSE